MGLIDAGLNLLGKTPNRIDMTQDATKQGVVTEKLPELTIDTPNDELTRISKKRQMKWEDSRVKVDIDVKGRENERYWKGEQYAPSQLDVSRPMVDNAIFEAMETYIPQATKRNPEPMVSLSLAEGEDEAKSALAKKMTLRLAEIADELKLRLKLKVAARYNELYLLSVAKMGWDEDRNIPMVKILRPEKLILDPDATIDEDGYTGQYIGEYRTMDAEPLLKILQDNGGEQEGIEAVDELVGKDTGTGIRFIEWTEDDKLFWTLGPNVLLKTKNVNWNDDQNPQPQIDPVTQQPLALDPKAAVIPGRNHFNTPRKPYVFLSVFNLGKQPVDDTSNTCQNLSNQDRLNKRNRQIDKGIDKQNGGTVVSLANAGLTQETVKPVTRALQNGGTVAIPNGDPEKAIKQIVGNNLPSDVYEDRGDIRNRIKDVWGTRGSSSAGLLEDKTVRGKYLNSQKDGDRVGGGISEYLEQFSDDIYNWFVQLLYVHDPAFIGDGELPKFKVSVKEGSLLPKDSASIAQEARELAAAGLMSKLDLYKRLDDPHPEETAANAWLEINAPEILYGKDPRVAQVIAAKAAMGNQEPPKAPSISIAYDSVPPDGQAQILAKAGINIHPEGIAAFNDHKATKEADLAKATAEHGASLEVKKAKEMPPKDNKPSAA